MTLPEAALAGTTPRLRLPRVWPLLRGLWYRRSVRVQLIIIIVVIDLVAAMVAGTVTILKARTSTRIEIAASMGLAELLVSEAVNLMQQEVPAERFLADLSSQLRLVRHVRIGVKDAAGVPLAVRAPIAPETRYGEERAPAPRWFAGLIAGDIESRIVPVVVNGQRIGQLEIVSEPKDEIAEVWENTVALGLVALLVNLAMIGILYVIFGRVLDPLTALASGLAALERQNYTLRLPAPAPRELAGITDRFNALAQTLEATRAENAALAHRLLTAQDDERRRTAVELHDEVGPSLFGLKANAASIATAVASLPGDAPRNVETRARDLLAIIEHLQTINRGILNRLRPMALGHVPLRDMLSQLVSERARVNPQIAFSFSADGLDRGYGDSADLTVYRCVQESLTNAIRHAQATRVDVQIREMRAGVTVVDRGSAAQLELTIRDDGLGIDPSIPPGFGMLGMRERVRALGGRYAIESGRGLGTCVRIAIPVRRGGDSPDAGGTV